MEALHQYPTIPLLGPMPSRVPNQRARSHTTRLTEATRPDLHRPHLKAMSDRLVRRGGGATAAGGGGGGMVAEGPQAPPAAWMSHCGNSMVPTHRPVSLYIEHTALAPVFYHAFGAFALRKRERSTIDRKIQYIV